MNKVVLIGRVTRDPVIRYTNGNDPMCIASFSIAVRRPKRKDSEEVSDFPNIKCFGKAAETIEKYVHTGDKLAIVGSLQTSTYTNKDGNKVFNTEVVVDGFPEFLELRSNKDYDYQEGDLPQSGYQVEASTPIPRESRMPVDIPQQKKEWERGQHTTEGEMMRNRKPTPSDDYRRRQRQQAQPQPSSFDDFMDIPSDLGDMGLPFN